MGNEAVVTGKARFSFVNVFKARAIEDGAEPKFSVTLLIPKSDVLTKQNIDRAMQIALQEGISTTFGGAMPVNPKVPIYDGDGYRPNGDLFGPECKGHWAIRASSKNRPEVVDINLQPIIDESAVYSGCYGRASLRFFAYNKSGNKGVGCGLGNVQKLADGEALAGGTTAAEDFGAVPAMGQSFTTPAIDPITGRPVGQ